MGGSRFDPQHWRKVEEVKGRGARKEQKKTKRKGEDKKMTVTSEEEETRDW